MKTLEQYFHENMDRDVTDFSVRARSFGSGRVGFYIHPDGRDGETLDFMVQGNTLALPAQNIDGFGFGIALDILKKGGKVRRTGWNGRGMWVEMQHPDAHSKMTLPYLYLNYPDNALNTPGARVPWLASQTDILATDWELV
jgi:hypothetical protein